MSLGSPLAPTADLRRLALAVAVLPPLWLALGLRPGQLLLGGDAVELLLPMYQRLLAARGDLGGALYDPTFLGGTGLVDVFGVLPLQLLLARLGVGATTALNLCALLLQTLAGFFTLRAATDLRALLRDPDQPQGPLPLPVLHQAALAVAGAFAPVLAWRLAWGHLLLALSSLPLLVAASLLLSLRARTLSPLQGVLAFVALSHVLTTAAFQCAVYAGLFGAPLLIGLWLLPAAPRPTGSAKRGAPLIDLVLLALPLVAALLVAAPHLARLLAHFTSSDSPRGLAGEVVTYSYARAATIDLVNALFLTTRALPTPTGPEFVYEFNYPFGPLLLLLLALPRRARPAQLGLAVSLVLALCFAADLRPVSSLLLALPPLRWFRVPERALLPLALAAAPLCLAALPLRLPDGRLGRPQLAAAAAALALCLVGPRLREAVLYLCCAAVAAPHPALQNHVRRVAHASAVAVLLALGLTLAFKERLAPFLPADLLQNITQKLRALVQTRVPLANQPLRRLVVDREAPPAGPNSAFVADLPSLTGYWVPPARFARLLAGLSGFPYDRTETNFLVPPKSPALPVLGQLYGVVGALRTAGPRVSLRPAAAPPGPTAFFPTAAAHVADLPAVVAALRAAPPQTLAQTVYLADDDPAARAALPDLAPCAAARLLRVETNPRGLLVSASAPAPCALVLSTNYKSDLRSDPPLPTFAADGALLGIVLPAGETTLTLSPPPPRRLDGLLWLVVPPTLWALFALCLKRRRDNDPTALP